MKSHGEGCASIHRSYGSNSTTSSTPFSSLRGKGKVCGCGTTLMLLKANTVKNKGRLLWRCRNWKVSKL